MTKKHPVPLSLPGFAGMPFVARAILHGALLASAACHSPRATDIAPLPAPTAVMPQQGIPTELLVSVVDYRVHFIDRTVPFDACSMTRIMSRPADHPSRLPAFVRSALNRQDADPCTVAQRSASPDSLPEPSIARVTFESFERSNSSGMVRLLVRAGENLHREEYAVRPVPPGTGWAVTEVRIRDAVRARFVTP